MGSENKTNYLVLYAEFKPFIYNIRMNQVITTIMIILIIRTTTIAIIVVMMMMIIIIGIAYRIRKQ